VEAATYRRRLSLEILEIRRWQPAFQVQ
jgi:hypothetical protein